MQFIRIYTLIQTQQGFVFCAVCCSRRSSGSSLPHMEMARTNTHKHKHTFFLL